ncbi:hypothetical protein PLICRDRAFT_35731 [Plicaturopsis crispa FD-325 SS-3]|nr:hypothetical protein PLICRDRAFT_35731 [Plicaturopsis crispa FD-325 SS-3]
MSTFDAAAASRGYYNCPETPSPVALSVKGEIPSWISGVLYRTGPGTFSIPADANGAIFEIRHWFDGLALHHRFAIQNGQVEYRSRKGATAIEDYIKRNGIYPPNTASFGQVDPCEKLLGKMFSKFAHSLSPIPGPPAPEGVQSRNVSVTISLEFNGLPGAPLVSKTDANSLQILDRVTLEPVGLTTYKSVLPELDGPLAAAHAGVDDEEGAGGKGFYNYTLKFGRKPTYSVFKIDPNGKGKVLAEIDDAPAAYLHTVFLTKRFVVLVIWQCDYKLSGLPILIHGSMSVNTFKPWSEKRKTLFYVIDRYKGGVVAKYHSDPFFAFHSLNSFDDEDGSIVIDIACYKNFSNLEALTLESLRHPSKDSASPIPTARRYRLRDPSKLDDASVSYPATTEFDLGPSANIELPTVAPSVSSRPYRYVYGLHNHRADENSPVLFSNALIKINMEDKTWKVWQTADGMQIPGEPIFVPRPDESANAAEDAGVLLTVVLDAKRGASALVVIDAQSMQELGRAEMDVPFPFQFHGAFQPGNGK